jgi:DNA topoisomerase-1
MMVIKWGRKGKFLACTGYPECRHTSDFATDEGGKVVVVEKEEVTSGQCPKCDKPMVVKNGRFGRFLACTGYPECKTTKPFTTGVKCPTDGCDGELLERRTKRGRIFFSCSNYPKCSYATWTNPVKE